MKEGLGQENLTVLVTGGARRIGASIVKALHRQGYSVALHCHHSVEEAQLLAGELNRQRQASCKVFVADLADSKAIDEMVEEVIAWRGELFGLINNASVFFPTVLGEVDDAAWERLFTINVKACWLLSEKFYPWLAKNQGSIVNITDIHGEKPLKAYSVYCMSKAALVMQTQALALEYAPKVRVNGIAPGAIAWPEGENTLSEVQQQAIINKTPLKKHGHPDYIAQAVLNLHSNPFITGQILAVDGGRSLD